MESDPDIYNYNLYAQLTERYERLMEMAWMVLKAFIRKSE